ncbi:AI-2E family transporter [Pseudomonas syringae]|uniref:Permease n=1 Tax=Pseudomonas syringae TaxID=317 RepID=A0A085VCZ8_PSESX|nr:AI-2E family transporter [Pseudomonas syringae]KFE53311.1 permease [Pseudomonas syringae]
MAENHMLTFNSSRELLDVLIRVGLIFVLAIFCYEIFRPFLSLMLWALILAITLYPLNQSLAAKLGNRSGWAAVIVVMLGLACLMVPLSLLGASIVESVQSAINAVENGKFVIPPPPDRMQQWPLIGAPLYQLWLHASQDLSWAFQQVMPHLRDWSRVVLHQAAGIGAGIVIFIFALILAGLIMAHGASGQRAGVAIASRITDAQRGPQITALCTATIRAVAQGVVGIAFIQMLLIGIGLVVMNVPAAGVIALGVLLLGIVQLPVLLISLPVVVYVFAQDGVGTATVIFAIWTLVAGLSDNVLKPLLLGRGVAVPMPVILIGALGGMVTGGIIGLFIGPVMLGVGYALFLGWVNEPLIRTAEIAPPP